MEKHNNWTEMKMKERKEKREVVRERLLIADKAVLITGICTSQEASRSQARILKSSHI